MSVFKILFVGLIFIFNLYAGEGIKGIKNIKKHSCESLIDIITSDPSIKNLTKNDTSGLAVHYLDMAKKRNEEASQKPTFFDHKEDVKRYVERDGVTPPKLLRNSLPENASFIDHELHQNSEAGVVKSSNPGNMFSIRYKVPFKYKDKNGVQRDFLATNIGISKETFVDNQIRAINGEPLSLVREGAKVVQFWIHGGGTNTTGHHTAQSASSQLKKYGVDVISLDMPWHGEGPNRDNSAFAGDELLEWINSFIIEAIRDAHKKGVTVILSGHSMGGMISDLYLRKYPAEKSIVDGVMVLSPPVDFVVPGNDLLLKLKKNMEFWSTVGQIKNHPMDEKDIHDFERAKAYIAAQNINKIVSKVKDSVSYKEKIKKTGDSIDVEKYKLIVDFEKTESPSLLFKHLDDLEQIVELVFYKKNDDGIKLSKSATKKKTELLEFISQSRFHLKNAKLVNGDEGVLDGLIFQGKNAPMGSGYCEINSLCADWTKHFGSKSIKSLYLWGKWDFLLKGEAFDIVDKYITKQQKEMNASVKMYGVYPTNDGNIEQTGHLMNELADNRFFIDMKNFNQEVHGASLNVEDRGLDSKKYGLFQHLAADYGNVTPFREFVDSYSFYYKEAASSPVPSANLVGLNINQVEGEHYTAKEVIKRLQARHTELKNLTGSARKRIGMHNSSVTKLEKTKKDLLAQNNYNLDELDRLEREIKSSRLEVENSKRLLVDYRNEADLIALRQNGYAIPAGVDGDLGRKLLKEKEELELEKSNLRAAIDKLRDEYKEVSSIIRIKDKRLERLQDSLVKLVNLLDFKNRRTLTYEQISEGVIELLRPFNESFKNVDSYKHMLSDINKLNFFSGMQKLRELVENLKKEKEILSTKNSETMDILYNDLEKNLTGKTELTSEDNYSTLAFSDEFVESAKNYELDDFQGRYTLKNREYLKAIARLSKSGDLGPEIEKISSDLARLHEYQHKLHDTFEKAEFREKILKDRISEIERTVVEKYNSDLWVYTHVSAKDLFDKDFDYFDNTRKYYIELWKEWKHHWKDRDPVEEDSMY